MTHLTFTATAHYSFSEGMGSPEGFSAHVYCTPEQAAAIASTFPKFVNVKAGSNSAYVHIGFGFSRANKGTNETGQKRLRKFLEIAKIEWMAKCQNSYPTLKSFTAAAL